MTRNRSKLYLNFATLAALSILAVAATAFGQEPAPPLATSQTSTPGWRKFSGPPPQQATPPQGAPEQVVPPTTAQPAVPTHLTLPAGTFVTVRIDQFLSSDKNKPGDGFSATLAKPLVANGLVVVKRGQTLGGRVEEAVKAGRVKGVSRLSIQLTSMTAADGQQVPIQTALTSFKGNTSNGRDAGAIATTTAVGAGIGAVADWGPGAAIGAGAGLIAGTVGVLVTRGRPTIIPPEAQLTFRLAKPVTISTENAPQAFTSVNAPGNEHASLQGRPPAPTGCGGPYGCPPPPPYYYGPAFYPYYWGPGFGFYFGPGFYFGRGFYGRGFGYRR